MICLHTSHAISASLTGVGQKFGFARGPEVLSEKIIIFRFSPFLNT